VHDERRVHHGIGAVDRRVLAKTGLVQHDLDRRIARGNALRESGITGILDEDETRRIVVVEERIDTADEKIPPPATRQDCGDLIWRENGLHVFSAGGER
jgi:hypothetical protein